MRTREELLALLAKYDEDPFEGRMVVNGMATIELLLDIRDQNERIISLLERQPRLVFIPTTANIHDIISEVKQELDRDA